MDTSHPDGRPDGRPDLRPAQRPDPWRDPGQQPYIRVDRVTKRFGDFVAVDDVSLDIYRGEFFSLLGGSGSGKTTLLRMLAGFEEPSEGRIFIDGVDMAGIAPYDRPVNMMFQSYALFPHMNVEQNIAFGLKQERMERRAIRQRVAEMLDLVQLGDFARRRPQQLSGGQRQRVALARALAKRPKLLLLDEPLGALDKRLRERTQFELMNIQDRLGVTFVVVTHDQEEAMTMSCRLAVMNQGYIVQTGTPSEVYEYPNSRFTAEFVGDVNIFQGRVVEDEPDHVLIRSDDAGCDLYVSHGLTTVAGSSVWVAIRPEKILLSKEPPDEPALAHGAGNRNFAVGVVREVAYRGDTSVYLVELDSGKTVRVTAPNVARRVDMPMTWDDRVYLSWRPYAGVVLSQ